MIEKIICKFLTNNLDIPAFPEKPEDPPERYILVEKTDGSCKNFINKSMISIYTYDASLYKTASLNEQVKNIVMDRLPEHEDICRVELKSEGNNTDTESKEYRYQTVFEITHY